MLLMLLRNFQDSMVLNLQNYHIDERCHQDSVFCDASIDYSHMMETDPVAAALWQPCHTRSSWTDADVPANDGGAWEMFTVAVCMSAGEISFRVVHHDQRACTVPDAAAMEGIGLSRSDVVTDYIEVLLDGPERRLQRMEFASIIVTSPSARDDAVHACEYRLQLPIYLPGTYGVQVMVVHSGIDLLGIEPYRNFVLWKGAHNISAQTFTANSTNPQDNGPETWRSAGGWVHTSEERFPELCSAEALVAQGWNAESYRCPANGTSRFAWLPLAGHLARTGSHNGIPLQHGCTPLTPQETMSCAQALTPQLKATYPKLVLFGDSLMRQTFNALSLGIGMVNATAIKHFKSLMESQDWGGSSTGLDLSFQWAPHPNDPSRSACKQALVFACCNPHLCIKYINPPSLLPFDTQ